MPLTSQALEVVLRRTSEMSTAECEQFRALFATVFGKPMPADLFDRKYAQAPIGGSFHALLKRDDVLVGALNAIPQYYNVRGQRHIFAIPLDLMILPEIRPAISGLQRMMTMLYQTLADNGVDFLFALVRSSVFPLHKRFGGWERIGEACYHVAAAPGCWTARAALSAMPRQETGEAVPARAVIRREPDEYRYRIFPSDYRRIKVSNGEDVVYVRKPYYPIEGVPKWLRIAYVVDAPEPVGPSLDEFVKQLRTREPDLHAVVYIGWTHIQSRAFRKLPARFQKPLWCVGGKILRPDLIDRTAMDPRNWNLSLGDGDLI